MTDYEADRDFDPEVLRARYREERDKRLRSDGMEQYQQPTGTFGYFVEDPYVEPGFTREPLRDEVDAVVVGGGIGGLLAAIRLKAAGLNRVRVIDKAGDFGGTWYWNRYPGVRCDVESYIYLPLLEETGYVPTEKYAKGSEILAYLQSLGRRHDLYEDACFQTGISAATLDEASGRWTVETDRGDSISARFVVMSSGPLSNPKLPGIPGIDVFVGHTFHTSRWDYGYTGGTTDGQLQGLADKRVAIIGTAATAIQCVPQVAEYAQHLYVFQRTPSTISERRNAPTDPEWAATLEPGWHRERMSNFNRLLSGMPQPVDLVGDAWTDMMRIVADLLGGVGPDGSPEEMAATVELADFTQMERLRARVDSIVEDPATAESLKPYYRMFCKRPCFSDDYLPTFNRPNVTLVDTKGRGVERLTADAVVVDGVPYEVDCVIFATGFEVGTPFARRLGFEVEGRDGVRLSDKWAEGMQTLHGFYTHGFPNMFFLGVTQTGLTINIPHMLSEQTDHLRHVVEHATKSGASRIEATREAEAAWVDTMRDLAQMNLAFLAECTPGYINQEGGPPDGHSYVAAQYGAGSEAFFALLEAWRDAGDHAGLQIS